jgi:uncharacterized membrane protein
MPRFFSFLALAATVAVSAAVSMPARAATSDAAKTSFYEPTGGGHPRDNGCNPGAGNLLAGCERE